MKTQFCTRCGGPSKSISCTKCVTPYRLKLWRNKHKLILLTLILSLIISMAIPNPNISVYAYNVYQDNSVDADSDIDTTANIGTDAATSYLNAQTIDADDQIITEGNGPGYVAATNSEDYLTAVTDTQSPTDIGTYSAWANMQADDGTDNTLTEANTAGAGGTFEYSPTGHNGSVASLTDPTLAFDGSLTTYAYGDIGAVDATPRYSLETWETSTGTITQVDIVVRFSAPSISGNDEYGMSWLTGASADQELWAMSTTERALANFTFSDITEPGDSTWIWSEIAAFSLFWDTDKNQGNDGDVMNVYEAVLVITTTATANYEFDREFTIASITANDRANEELCISTGTMGAESLKVDVWESAAWVNVLTLVDANDDTWVNTSITTWLDASTEYFRFIGNTETGDTTTADTWGIDAILIHTWGAEVLDYELQWEHQAQSVDVNKDAYNITVYGSSTEDISIQTWDIAGTDWNTALTLDIGSAEDWYNQSIDANAIGESITWRYIGTAETGDTSQSVLTIDYAGILGYNFSMNIIEATFGIDNYDPGSGNQSIDEGYLQIQTYAGIQYDIQIKGTDGTGTPITNGWIYYNSVDNVATASKLLLTYEDLYLTLDPNDGGISLIYLWLDVPFTEDDGVLTMSITIQIIKS